MISLALVWLGLIAFIIIMYVILDGFTLGVGLLFPWIKSSKDRDTMIVTVLPVWDGNETWLVFAGASLYAGFPEAFAVLMSAFYLPLMLLIVGLLLRGVSFEFIHKATSSVHIWEKSFFAGSLMAVVAQGIVVGKYVQGFTVDPVTSQLIVHSGINWFDLFCIVALIMGYSLLGSARLIKKTHGALQERFFIISNKLQWLLLIAILFVGIYSPISSAMNGWFNLYNSPFMIMFIIVTLMLMGIHAFAIRQRVENLPFMALIGIFIMAYIGFAVSNLPYIVPRKLTFMQTKADDGALTLMLYAVAVLLPLLIFYTAYAYHIFGGKTDEKTRY
ncbi:MAG: cydB [Burkholderiales bacterium]|jgi:cytochrome d ubiquinol oxidase subunit II|nr:cydB [Burkholderiales bacterium]MCE3267901.1 cydB [Burkholderiales bacterium]